MRRVLAGAVMSVFGLLAWGAQPVQPAKKKSSVTTAKKQVPARKAPPQSAHPTTTARQAPARSAPSTARKAPARPTPATTAARKKGAPAKASSKQAPARTVATRTRQLAPTPQRYREIQDALAAKGYLKPEDANGAWGQSSTEALKRFQAEQKIESTGKINSLSLIALGLGPKRDSAAAKSVAPPTPPPPDRF